MVAGHVPDRRADKALVNAQRAERPIIEARRQR